MMNLPDIEYVTLQSERLSDITKRFFWNALAEADTLKYRWCDMVEPTVKRVMKRITDEHTYYVVDFKNHLIIAEFSLENFTGKAAQIHYCMHPNNTYKKNMQLAKDVTDKILNEWITPEGTPYLNTLFGLTSVDNRVATMFIGKAGFERKCVLPSGTTYLGKVTDAMVSMKERKNGR